MTEQEQEQKYEYSLVEYWRGSIKEVRYYQTEEQLLRQKERRRATGASPYSNKGRRRPVGEWEEWD